MVGASPEGFGRAPLLGHPLRGRPAAGGYEGVGLAEAEGRAARCTCREAIRFPDERSEEPCEARSQEGARPQGPERQKAGRGMGLRR